MVGEASELGFVDQAIKRGNFVQVFGSVSGNNFVDCVEEGDLSVVYRVVCCAFLVKQDHVGFQPLITHIVGKVKVADREQKPFHWFRRDVKEVPICGVSATRLRRFAGVGVGGETVPCDFWRRGDGMVGGHWGVCWRYPSAVCAVGS